MMHRRFAGGPILAALLVASAQAQELPNGKAVYDANCAACHATGVAGAPRTGDAAAWSVRFDKGINALYVSAIKGTGAMPPKGGNAALSEAQVMAAVNHIAGLSAAPDLSPATGRKGAKPAETAKAAAPVAADTAKGKPVETAKAAASVATETAKGKPVETAKAGAPVAAETAKAGAPAAGDSAKGKLVYQATCAACHASGLAGAPKLGDVAAWAPRASAGTAALYANAIKGKGAMPPKGGNASLPDADLRAAVDFMLAQVRGEAAPPKPGVPVAPAAPKPAPSIAAAASAPVAAAPAPSMAASAPVAAAPAPSVAASAPAAATPNLAVQESADPNSFNRLMLAPARRNRPPVEDGIHDPASPGTALLQPPLRAFQSLPRSELGNYVNWVAALGSKRIQPRWDVLDPKAQAAVMDLNIVREVKGSMPDVVFPHKQHTEWLDCSNCHPAIFTPQKGSNQISMAAIMLGQKCGVCHGKVAFPISECRLCHARQKSAEARSAEAKAVEGGKR
jgi:c(7)-type cytochrome triheme protein